MNSTSPEQRLHAALAEAVALHGFGQIARAKEIYETLLQASPRNADLLLRLGTAECQLGHHEPGVRRLAESLAIAPDQPLAYNNRANGLFELQRFDEALADYDRALALQPGYFHAQLSRGNALCELRRHEEALASYARAIELAPGAAEAYFRRGTALCELERFDQALADLDRAVAIAPEHFGAHSNRSSALLKVRRVPEALAAAEHAIALAPDCAEAHGNRGYALNEMQRLDDALGSFGRALALRPDCPYMLGNKLHLQMQLCDWRDFDDSMRRLLDGIGREQKVATPFSVVGLVDAPDVQLRCARIYSRAIGASCPSSRPRAAYAGHDRIRIGYFSADFHEHATMHLMAELFEKHDRTQFELHAFSFGPDSQNPWRHRAVAAFDRFHEVRSRSDREIASLARALEIDVAVDLKGFTQDARPRIFAAGAAPVQASYLGFPGTSGSEDLDYLIADRVVIPRGAEQFYSEKIVRLPGCYQANCADREVSDRPLDRAASGLPEAGCVFCSFNNTFKITPDVFAIWMRVLQRVEGSVLWLLMDNAAVIVKLMRAAEALGVDPRRLVFAQRLPVAEHLNRLRLADLFLDTFPYTAHTTASDALRMGLPVLTRAGASFASRVAASLLDAVGMPELVTATAEDYETLAVRLGTNPEERKLVRRKLAGNLPTCALFDSGRFARGLESAYRQMVERCRQGLPPAAFDVQ